MGQVRLRGIRGATTVSSNTKLEILKATGELLVKIVDANHIGAGDIAAVWFSVTPDLNAAFPAEAARSLGWNSPALFCCQEIDVPGSLLRCIRVMVLVNTVMSQDEVKHIYLNEARQLREDL